MKARIGGMNPRSLDHLFALIVFGACDNATSVC